MTGLQAAHHKVADGWLVNDIDWDSPDDRLEKVFDKLFPVKQFIPDEKDLGFDAPGASATAIEPPEPKRKGVVIPLDTSITDQQRLTFFTRAYCATKFDTELRPQWTRPEPANDNHKHKHSWPARDDAINNVLMVGDSAAETGWLNGQAFHILETISNLVDETTPTPDWIKHNGHGAKDEMELDDNSGYGGDVIHDYGPSVKKIKWLYEHGNDNEPSKEEMIAQSLGYVLQWNLGTGCTLAETETFPNPDTGLVKTVNCLRDVGGLRFNLFSHMTAFRKKTGWLSFQTKTRGLKGKKAAKLFPDPVDISIYTGADLPRNKKGELETTFLAGKPTSSNSVYPQTSENIDIGPTHSFSDPYVATIRVETAREEATIRLSQYRSVCGDDPYEALIDAAGGFRMSEYCGGVEGDKRDSAAGRVLLQTAIQRVIEDRASEQPIIGPKSGGFGGF
jgi:hypothetical protein